MPEPTKLVRFANILPSSLSRDTRILRSGSAPNMTHLSACIDPKTLDPQELVMFPSGERIDYNNWFQDPERPPSTQERQKAITQNFQIHIKVKSLIRSEKGRKPFQQ